MTPAATFNADPCDRGYRERGRRRLRLDTIGAKMDRMAKPCSLAGFSGILRPWPKPMPDTAHKEPFL